VTCTEREAQISAFLDAELESSAKAELEAHLAVCPSCSARLRDLRELSQTVRTGASRLEPGAELERRLGEAIRANRPGRFARAAKVAKIVCLAAAAGVIGWLLAVGWSRPSEERRVGEEVVAAHVRSLLADHLTDVASSDRHQVNPWFQGKVDFAVGARDHADRGFVLKGGRLDYIDGAVVAAVVYVHGPHAMNLFSWSSRAGRNEDVTEIVIRGYHVAHWSSGGTERWVVSDADESTVRELVGLVRSGE
jgi:anti-sigma factor RsiW